MEGVQPNEVVDSILFVIALISLSLNVTIATTTLRRKVSSWAIDSTLIFLVSTFDSISALFLIISQIIKWISAYEIVHSDSIWCYSSAIIFCSIAMITITLTGLLSLARYLAIVRRRQLNNRLFTGIAIILILISWLIFGLASVEFMFNKEMGAKLTLSPSGIYCIPRPKTQIGLILFGVSVLILTVPALILIPICYGFVILQYNKILVDSNLELVESNGAPNFTMKNIPYDRKYRYKVVTLILIVFCYLITTVPEILAAIVESVIRKNIKHGPGNLPEYQRSPVVDGIIITLLFSVTIVNAVFVLLLHDETLKELKSRFKSLWKRQNV